MDPSEAFIVGVFHTYLTEEASQIFDSCTYLVERW